ncbi:MAG: ATP synthase subunit C [Candidatus Omnitrophica bacterium]|nr:ATP synthase subunit C [Candidatus Omnitrophota bacterium]
MRGAKKVLSRALAAGFITVVFFNFAWAQGIAADSSVAGWAFLSAALVTGLSGIGAGIAVAYVGAAAVGAISEKPEVTGKTILYVGLAEGIAILGFGIAFIILSKVQ